MKDIICPKCTDRYAIEYVRHCDKSSVVKCSNCNYTWRTKSKRKFELQQCEIKIKPKWTPTIIRFLLSKNNYAVLRGIELLYDRQSFDEKICETTFISNKKGFDSFDAKICSKIALKIKKGELITKKEMDICRRKTMKYAKQLADIANSKKN